jgi:hypothetical protein
MGGRTKPAYVIVATNNARVFLCEKVMKPIIGVKQKRIKELEKGSL